MNKCIYSHCEICHTYRKREVDNKIFRKLEKLGLIYGKSKIFIICKECLKKMKEGEDNECDD